MRAIEGLTLTVQAGEVLGIVGESGCGKSVTALSVMRLIPPKSGRIVQGSVSFEGKDLATLDDAQMRAIRGNQIAMVFQEPMTSLNPVHTIGAQIAEAVRIHQGLSRAGRAGARGRDAGPGPDSGRRAPRARLSARILGRHAPARDDRDGPVVQPETADRRRTDHRARCHDPGADSQADG